MKSTLLSNLIAAACLSAGLFIQSTSAQILVSAGSPYTQNFDSLGSVSNAWTDNGTLPGWYASQSTGGPTVAGYRAATGSSTAGAFYSFGVAGVNPITDRALGSIASGTPGNFAYGVRFQNDTTKAMTNITISYTGEQWRDSGNAATQTLAFSYIISYNPITSPDVGNVNNWSAFNALNFNSPRVGTAGALDGNATANRQVFSAALLTNVVVFPGQEVFFRWYDTDDAGVDHGLAIDDLTISFTSVIAVTNPPAIAPSGQPQSRTNNAGTRATFAVTATGSAPSYQWRLNTVDLTDNAKISGATTPSLSISNVLAADAGNYTIFVYNGAGQVTSSPAVLTVIDPAVNTQPVSRTNLAGDTANFFAGAAGTGSPLSYQWRFNGTGIAGATLSSLNVPNVQSTNQGGYSVVVGNDDSTIKYATSSVANLTLQATPAIRIARWDFNATNSLATNAPISSSGSGTAALVNGTKASWSTGTFSDPAGAPGADNSGWNTTSYPSDGTGNKTAGVQFNVSTLGYQNILLAWEQRHSDTASKYTRLQYTTDGSTFVDRDLITMTSTNNGFVFYASNLSAIPGVNNNSNFAFRIVSEWEATAIGNNNSNYVGSVTAYSTGGTIRFDLMSVYGNVFSASSQIPLNIQSAGSGNVKLTWTDPAFALQSAPVVTGTYANVPSATSPYTNPITGSRKFFRLLKN